MATILITGATGAVGGVVARALKSRGHRLIFLVRGDHVRERLAASVGQALKDDDRVWHGDVSSPLARTAAAEIREWRGGIDHVVHLAGSIKFDDRVAYETRRTNVDGTRHMLELADALGRPRFHHMSTAYVAGDKATFSEFDAASGQVHRNEYERSKMAAEELVRAWPGDAIIYRMGIMVGEYETGACNSFTGYYGFFQSFWQLKAYLRDKWATSRQRLLREGIRFRDDGRLDLPLVVRCSATARLNLVPADWIGATMTALIDRAVPGLTYHLVHPQPPKVRWAIETSLDHLAIHGVRYDDACGMPEAGPLLQRLQKGLDMGLERYHAYVMHGPHFASDNLVHALGGAYCCPPPIDAAYLARLLDVAVRRDFGKRPSTSGSAETLRSA